MKIIEDPNMVDHVEDWSNVRSRSRAERRRRQGHPQRVKVTAVPKMEGYSIEGGRTVIMHPNAARELRRVYAESRDKPWW